MTEKVTRFSKDKKHIDNAKKRLKPDAFWNKKRPHEISVVDIDEKIKLANSKDVIFSIGDLIYKSIGKLAVARGDMARTAIESITCGPLADNLLLENSHRPDIPGHYNIRVDCNLPDLIVKTNIASRLSHISVLDVR